MVSVHGDSEEAGIPREMLIGGRLYELGCGIYPKPPRVDIDLAVLNSPGWLHFGITHLRLHLQCVVPKWEELYIHVKSCDLRGNS